MKWKWKVWRLSPLRANVLRADKAFSTVPFQKSHLLYRYIRFFAVRNDLRIKNTNIWSPKLNSNRDFWLKIPIVRYLMRMKWVRIVNCVKLSTVRYRSALVYLYLSRYFVFSLYSFTVCTMTVYGTVPYCTKKPEVQEKQSLYPGTPYWVKNWF